MKQKLVSLILAVAVLLSFTTLFATAEEGEATLLIRRTFDEGWDITNGFSNSQKVHKYFIDNELNAMMEYNYYIHLQYNTYPVGTAGDGYFQYVYSAMNSKTQPLPDHSVLQFDISFENVITPGQIVQSLVFYKAGNPTAGSTRLLETGKTTKDGLTIGTLSAFGMSLGTYETGEWYTITYDFAWAKEDADALDWSYGEYTYTTNNGTCTVTMRDSLGEVVGQVVKRGDIYRIPQIRVGDGTGRVTGDNAGIDNFTVYELRGTDILLSNEELAKLGYGSSVNANAAKPITIQKTDAESMSKKLLADYLKNSVMMKAGSDYYLLNNKTRAAFKTDAKGDAYGGPVEKDGLIYLPLSFLLSQYSYRFTTYDGGRQIDFANGKNAAVLIEGGLSAMVNGETVLLEHAPFRETFANGDTELYLSYPDVRSLFPDVGLSFNEMNVVVLAEDSDIITKADTMTLVASMKLFLFDNPSGDKIYADVKATTDNFTHPYIYANQSRFDELRAAYLANEGDANYDPVLKQWLTGLINGTASNLSKVEDPTTHKPKILPGNRYDPNDFGLGYYNGFSVRIIDQALWDSDPGDRGYDRAGGRCNNSANATSILSTLGFAWQITREDKYAIFAYYYAAALADWEHWGPDHFLNCADATREYAIGYDWLYNAWKDLGLDTTVIRNGLYNNGVNMGYLQCIQGSIPASVKPQYHNQAGDYTVKTNNWNCVCCSGITIGALAMLDDTDATRLDHAKKILARMVEYMPRYGMDEYVPDGSYVESATYWIYGTNNFFKMAMALDSAAGSTYGLMDCWGIDRTMDYACHIESSDLMTYSYHDTNAIQSAGAKPSSMDTTIFAWYGEYMNRPELAALRLNQVKDGVRGVSVFDALYYDKAIMENAEEMALDYLMTGIEAYVSRSDWERGALYVGIMGGPNQVSHGNIDSGSFVYYNRGKTWLVDLGSDNYNVTGYFNNNYRFKYFRCGGEGQNNLIVTKNSTIPYGQDAQGSGVITATRSNAYGSAVLLDNSSCYPKLLASDTTAMRGMLVTNDRETVVIQDEVSFAATQSFAWIVNYTTGKTVTISEDGRTAYMRDGNDVLRLSIVSDHPSLRFSIMDDYTYLLSSTFTKPEDYVGTNGVVEYSRDMLRRLVIEGSAKTLSLAVVMEMVESENSTEPVGYAFTPMANWEPAAKSSSPVTPGPIRPDSHTDPDVAPLRPTAALDVVHSNMDVRTGVVALRAMEEDGTLYSDPDRFAYWVSFIQESFRRFPPERLPSQLDEYLEAYEGYLAKYTALRTAFDGQSEVVNTAARALLGMS